MIGGLQDLFRPRILVARQEGMGVRAEIGHRRGNLAKERKRENMKHLRPISKASLDGTKELTADQIISMVVTLLGTLSSILVTILQSKTTE